MLASRLSRVMPALCTTTSTPPCAWSRCRASRCGASTAVTSRVTASPPSSVISSCRSEATAGTSTPTTVAPSRCRTRAMEAPMPREAPVTSTTRPAQWARQSSVPASVGPPDPTRTTWPETYADLGESRNASVEPRASSAPGATWTSCAVAPARISLPSERVKPSRARWATCSSTPLVSEGGVPSTTSRAFGSSRRSSGVKNSRSAASPATSSMPVASSTNPLARAPSASVSGRRHVHARQQPLHGVGDPAALGAPDHHGAVDEGSAGCPPLQRRRVRQAEVLDDEPAHRGVGEELVAVGHAVCPISPYAALVSRGPAEVTSGVTGCFVHPS